MPINLEGVELLKADLRANAANYHQLTFGRVTECGTVQCMAGFCRIREVGRDAYTSEVLLDHLLDISDLCIGSGASQLGINYDPDGDAPTIFDVYDAWPFDLRRAYGNATTPEARVEVACAALDRLNDDGTIKALDQI